MNLEEVVFRLHPVCREVFKGQVIPAVDALREALERNQHVLLAQKLEQLEKAHIAVWEEFMKKEVIRVPVANQEYLRESIAYDDAFSGVYLAVKIAQKGRPGSSALAMMQFKAGIQYMVGRLPKKTVPKARGAST